MKAVNIKDIARLAGVGVSTVSRVLNGHQDVKDETRERILDIMAKQNYVPNNSARNLKLNNTKTIGVMVKGTYNPFFSKMVEVIEKLVTERGYSLILHYNSSGEADMAEAALLIKEKRLNGLICLGGNFSQADEDYLREIDTPIVLTSSSVSEDLDQSLYASVTITDEDSAFKATNYLCQLGHRHIGLITTGSANSERGQLRTNGYYRALRHNQIPIRSEYVALGEYTFSSGYQQAMALVEAHPDLTAIFVTTDTMALGAAKGILQMGKRIPDDISIIGFDGLEFNAYFHPALSTIEQPISLIAKEATDLLFSQMMADYKNRHVILDTKLLIRESCKKI